MSGVADGLRELIENWHGRKYASLATLAAKIEEDTGKDVRNRLYRELQGRPTWECVEWIVEYCSPADAPPDWRQRQLEDLAGRWSVEHAKMPPGYVGRVVHGGEELRSAVSSSVEADDLLTQVTLLKREREAAESAVARQENQVAQLRDEVASLRTEADRINQESILQLRRFSDNADTLLEQLRLVQGQLDESVQASAQLLEENRRYQEQHEAMRRERDEARDLASRRYQELEQLRDSAEAARRRLHQTIDDLEGRVAGLRRELDQARDGLPAGVGSTGLVSARTNNDERPPPRKLLGMSRDGVLRRDKP